MNDGRTQDLSETFSAIIAMMLKAIRAHGIRCLIHLPKLLLVAIQLRRYGKQFAAVMAAYNAGTLQPAAPTPAPALWTAPPEPQAACAQPPAPPRPAARPDPPDREQRRPAVRPVVPACAAQADRPRAEPAPAMPRRAPAMPRAPALIPLPESLAGVAAVISKKIASARGARVRPIRYGLVTTARKTCTPRLRENNGRGSRE